MCFSAFEPLVITWYEVTWVSKACEIYALGTGESLVLVWDSSVPRYWSGLRIA